MTGPQTPELPSEAEIDPDTPGVTWRTDDGIKESTPTYEPEVRREQGLTFTDTLRAPLR